MSNKNRPQSRPQRRPRTKGISSPSAAAQTGAPKKQKDQHPTTLLGRTRRFLLPVAITELVFVLIIVVLAFGAVLIIGGRMAALPASIAELWMITNLAPVVFDAITVSVLPMVPAMGLIGLMAYRVHRLVKTKVSMIDLGVLLASVFLVPVLLTLIAWAMLWDASRVFPVEAPPLWQALARTVVVHLVALVLGMGPRLWRAVAARYSVPATLIDGAVDAWRFFWRMSAASVVLLVIVLAFGWERQEQMIEAYGGLTTAGIVGLIALSVLYLPNAVISAAAVLLGSEVQIGDAGISLFSIHLVPLPPLPLTALIPGQVSQWAPLLLLVSAGVASWVMVKARPGVLRAVGAGAGAGLIALVATYLAGGELGWYSATGPAVWMTTGLAAVWLLGIGLATALAIATTQRVTEEPEEVESEE